MYLPPDACPRVTKQMSLLPNCWLSQSYPRTHSTILSSIQEVVLLTHWLSHPSATFPSTVFPPSLPLWGPHAPILEEFLGTQCLRGAHPSSHGCAFSAHPPSLVLQMKWFLSTCGQLWASKYFNDNVQSSFTCMPRAGGTAACFVAPYALPILIFDIYFILVFYYLIIYN